MERIIILLLLILFLSSSINSVNAQGIEIDLSTLITSQNVKYQDCNKIFNIDNVTLFHMTIAAINANRFTIDEIQSKSGYILFTAVNKQFLATVLNVNKKQSLLRITPADGNYYFQPGIVSNIFKYIQMNKNEKIQNL